MMPPSMPPIRLMLAALWEGFRLRTRGDVRDSLAHARIRLGQADAVERAALREWDRFCVTALVCMGRNEAKVPKKLARRKRRMSRRLRRLAKRTDRWARIVGTLDKAVNQ